MVICRYFLQGTCKFGNNCRYEHSYREYENEGSPANSYRRTYGGQYNDSSNRYSYVRPSPSGTNVRELMQAVINELSQSERGGQWPLSCFAPFKERQCYPGLDDYSPEEIRWQMYEAVKSGTVEDCKRRIQQLEELHKARKNLILHPNAETYATIEKLFRGDIAATNFTQNSQSSTSAPPQFSFNIAHHGSEQRITPNLFGGSPAHGSGNNVIVPNLFGGSGEKPPQSNIFNTTAQNIPAVNVFGRNQSSCVPHIFGNQGTVTRNVFGPGTEAVNNSAPFLRSQQSSFSNLGLTVSSELAQKSAQPAAISNIQEGNLYTSLNELTESERNSFSAQTFRMGHIPSRPPPKELSM